MAEQHPTIPGVTSDEYINGNDALTRVLITVFPPESRYSIPPELVVFADSGAMTGPIGIMCSFDTQDGIWLESSEAETVIAMIRDQAEWLTKQEAHDGQKGGE